MTELEATFFDLLEPEAPDVAPLGEDHLRLLAFHLATTARDAVAGVMKPGECDVAMRQILRGGGYPRHLAAPAARRLVEFVA